MKEFTTSGFFALRTPLFPLGEFQRLSADLTASSALNGNGDLAQPLVHDRALVRRRLQELAQRPEVKEALWIASPEFMESLAIWWREPESDKGRKLEHSLYRYVARMTSRPTPFGLFAGCSVGRIGDATKLELGPRSQYARRSRLDMEYLCNLADKIIADPGLRAGIKFRPNTSLYLAAGRYHHVQGHFVDKVRVYKLVATEYTPYLAVTLERAGGGATPGELATALVKDDPDILLAEAEAYIGQLIDSQVLVPEVVPPITGPEPAADMIVQLQTPETASLANAISCIATLLEKLDQGRLGNPAESYQELISGIAALPAAYKLDHLIQVDMTKPAAGSQIDRRLIDDILRGVETLHSIYPRAQQDSLRQFKQDFRERYQDQEIPLVLALDDEIGIGFEKQDSPGAMAEPLLDELEIGRKEDPTEVRARKADAVLLRKLEELARQNKQVLELDAALLKALKVENPLPLPDAFSVMGMVGGGEKRSFYLQSVSGPSGAILLGRFCHADAELNACVHEHLRAEEAAAGGDAVFAEVAHLPEGRVGNVLFRPVLRQYEIPYLSTSRVPAEQQIPVTDLTVAVENDRIVLRSRRLGREVLPRLTSAHGFFHGRNLKLYKFLCLLQSQGVAGGLSWSWGFLDQRSFLPRVTYQNLVLALARWALEKEVVEKLSKEQGAQRYQAVDHWRKENRIPRWVMLSEADHQLLIDFENVVSVDAFVEYAKKRPGAHLVELYAGPDELAVSGPEGRFTHEVVIPMVRREPVKKQETPRIKAAPVANAQRNFLPGSEWLFVKIYGSASHLDRLLVEELKPLVEDVLGAGEADSWFFIRYGDPHWHLRLRFHGGPATLAAKVIPRIWELGRSQAENDKLWRVQIDTYEREIERYGGIKGMAIAERLFQFDSELALQLLASISDRLGSKLRWQMAVVSIDRLLAGLGLDTRSRRVLLNSMGKSQEKNFLTNESYRKQLSEKFRKERQALEGLIFEPARLDDFPAATHQAWEQYAAQVQEVRGQLEDASRAGELAVPIFELASSYVHMHLNRMFRSSANAQEMVLYDFLARTYDSKLARERAPVETAARK